MRFLINLSLVLLGCAGAPVAAPVPVPVPVPAPVSEAVDCARELEAAAAIGDLVVEAYREKDIIKLNCASDKLTQVEGILLVMQAHFDQFACAADEAERRHHVAVIDVACRKIAVLRSEANNCVGEELVFGG